MTKYRYSKNSDGFTIIELLIVIAVVAVFGALTAGMLANATDIYSDSLVRQKFISEVRSSFFKIIREATWQKSYTSFAGSNNKKLNIYSTDGKSIDYEIRNNNDIIQNNDQVPGSNNEILTDKIEYSSSNVYYLDQQGTGIDIVSQIENVRSLKLDFQFSNDTDDLRLQSHTLPYNLRIGRAMSYHE